MGNALDKALVTTVVPDASAPTDPIKASYVSAIRVINYTPPAGDPQGDTGGTQSSNQALTEAILALRASIDALREQLK